MIGRYHSGYGCPSRGSGFNSQHPHGSLRWSVSPITFFGLLRAPNTHVVRDIHAGKNAHENKTVIFKSLKEICIKLSYGKVFTYTQISVKSMV